MTMALRYREWLGLCLLLLAAPAIAETASLTYTEGSVALLRGTATYGATAGVELNTGDMIETGAKGQAQIEFAGGLILNLGPESGLYLINTNPASGKAAEFALGTGWLKISAPAGRKGNFHDLDCLLSAIAIEIADATVVIHAADQMDEAFIESGAASVSEISPEGVHGKTQAAKGGEFASRGNDTVVVVERPRPGFLASMPKHYRDNLSPLYSKMKDLRHEPTRDHDTTYAEAEIWLKANKAIRQGLVARYHSRAKDPEFRSAVLANINAHPEWARIVGSGTGATKK